MQAQLLIGDIFRRNALDAPNAPALSLDDVTLTHAELDQRANQLAWTLRDRGIRHGDRVLAWADTQIEVVPLFVALAKLGAIFAPLDAKLGVEEAIPTAELARARMLIADPGHAEMAAALASKLPEAPALAQLGASTPGPDLWNESKAAKRSEPRTGELRESDPHVIFFTSGSTGRSKGVVLSHRANYLRGFQGVFRDTPERSVSMFPLYHMAPFTLGLAAWQTRGHLILVRQPSAENLLAAVERHRANRLYCIPAVWSRILSVPEGRFDLSSLREVDTGTSATPIELVRALKERFPATATRIYYGSTEVGSGTTLPDEDVLRKPGSVGLPSPGVELRIARDGEILLRSPYLMDGYFRDPDASAEALRDGWFYTGDLGALDEDGYLCVVGRKKEIIRTGGESVTPGEVEAVLRRVPGVREVAVIGLPDPEWGEVVCAVVACESGQQVDLAALQAHCQGRLARFKRPRQLVEVAELPRTGATRQVQRTLLVQQILARQHS